MKSSDYTEADYNLEQRYLEEQHLTREKEERHDAQSFAHCYLHGSFYSGFTKCPTCVVTAQEGYEDEG